MKYNYFEAIREDVREYIEENYTAEEIRENLKNREEWEEKLNDDLWINDHVTGNGSGSYTFSRRTAEEYVKDNLSLCIEAMIEFGNEAETFGKKVYNEEWEYFDVSIRCYLLNGAISDTLNNLEKELED